jgi:DNA-directed RNA polymerase subunit beta
VEFEFDANDILQVRIDRRRKMLATAFLRAFCFLEKGTVLSDEEILGAFYDLEEVVGFEDGTAVVKLNPEIHRHETPVAEDIKQPRHREPIVPAGRRLNKSRVERMVEAGIAKFPVPVAWLENRRTGGRVVDSKTGEVLLEANQPLTSNELAKIAAQAGALFKVVFEGRQERRVGARRWLATAPEPRLALVEMYRRPAGDPPTVESARALFGAVLDARHDLSGSGGSC